MKQFDADHSFTLIEIIIVVAIIGILVAIAVPNFLNAPIQAKVAAVESNFRTFSIANEMYRLDHGSYLPFINLSTVIYQGATSGFTRMTTPVAYLSYDAVMDPFGAKFNSGAGGGGMEYDKAFDYMTSLGTRAYEGNEILLTKQGNYYTKKANAYLLESVGPDALDSIYNSGCFGAGCSFEIFAIYNPSNGIISQGDIIHPGGSIPSYMKSFLQ